MIRIERLHITRFRGILDLNLEIGQRNYAVAGPNGTGKSGVVDAIEFALSGDISRLSGKGRGDVSVKAHAPHVDYRDHPDDAVVELDGVLVSSGKKFSISRSVGKAKFPAIAPNDPDVVAAIAELGRHKNTTLSRRELIQYILSTPGDRAAEINALLQLNQLRDLRATFQKIANSADKAHRNAKAESGRASENLATALGIPALKTQDLLTAVNDRRATLGLPALQQLDATTSIKDGLSVAAEKASGGISKSVAVAEIEKVSTALDALPQEQAEGPAADAIGRLDELSGNSDFKNGISRHDLLERALALVEEDSCPVCETAWNAAELIELISKRMEDLETVIAEKKQIQAAIQPVVDRFRGLSDNLNSVAAYGLKLDPKVPTNAISSHASTLARQAKQIETFSTPDEVIAAFKASYLVPNGAKSQVAQLLKAAQNLPETAAREAARDYLVAVSERLDTYRQARRLETKAKQEQEVSAQVFEIYSSTYEDGLNEIYADIQDSFAELYRSVNQDDEDGFEASMAAERAGLGLEVEFFGRGKFPPGAYHSEGHQDGMGLCLYLALMRHLYGEEFRFCVLDDVLMSVDAGHRRAVCRLLAEKFPNTQFIFTTHDDVWLQNMRSSGLIASKDYIQFRNWSVDGGPAEWAGDDIWTEVFGDIQNNDVKRAAAGLRHYLEFLAGQVCHNLRAPVVYRGDNRHTLGDLLPQALSALKKALKEAKAAAQSWGNDEELKRLDAEQLQLETAIAETKAEEWALNAKVHYNEVVPPGETVWRLG
ncbi:MAG: AAA family ATPase [Rhizobiaceae bacterium]|nr:AAA family ATPase [Rhizobiaceae bacterium]